MLWSRSFKELSKLEKLLAFLFYLLLILNFGECFVPFLHGDALSYHLVLPKLILERGFIQAHEDFYLGNIAGLFDYLYIIPQWIFDSKLRAQIISQMMHTSVSLFLAVFIFYKIFGKAGKKDKITFYLASISLLTFARSADFFHYAKNDGALAVTFLLGTLLTFKRIGGNLTATKRNLFIGLCLGLLPAIKMSGLIYSAALGLFYVFKNKHDFKGIALATLLSLAIVSITFVKKWVFVGNPLFPAFLELFPTKATPEMIAFMNGMLKKPASLSGVLQNYLIAFSPKAIGFLVIPSFLYNIKKRRHELNQLVLLLLFFTTLYCLINPGYPAERFYFGCHFVLFYYLAETLFYFLKESTLKISHIAVFLLIFVLVDSKIDKIIKRNIELISRTSKLGFGKELLQKYIPHTEIWDYVAKDSNILSDFMPMQYYAPKGSLLYQSGHAEEANFLRTCDQPQSNEIFFFNFYIRNRSQKQCVKLDENIKSKKWVYGTYEVLSIDSPQ